MSADQSSKYTIIGSQNSAMGDDAFVINTGGTEAIDPQRLAALLPIVNQMRNANAPSHATFAQTLEQILSNTEETKQGVADLLKGQLMILARFDESEQKLLTNIVARLDAQTTMITEQILGMVDAQETANEELSTIFHQVKIGLDELCTNPPADENLAAQIEQIHTAVLEPVVADPEFAIRHKLKLAIPIIPTIIGDPLLSYEGEVELGQSASIAEAWSQLRGLVSRRNSES